VPVKVIKVKNGESSSGENQDESRCYHCGLPGNNCHLPGHHCHLPGRWG